MKRTSQLTADDGSSRVVVTIQLKTERYVTTAYEAERTIRDYADGVHQVLLGKYHACEIRTK